MVGVMDLSLGPTGYGCEDVRLRSEARIQRAVSHRCILAIEVHRTYILERQRLEDPAMGERVQGAVYGLSIKDNCVAVTLTSELCLFMAFQAKEDGGRHSPSLLISDRYGEPIHEITTTATILGCQESKKRGRWLDQPSSPSICKSIHIPRARQAPKKQRRRQPEGTPGLCSSCFASPTLYRLRTIEW